MAEERILQETTLPLQQGGDAHFQIALQLWRQHGQRMSLSVVGESMLPLLRPSDCLTVVPRDNYHIGAIVLFQHGDTLVVHRIVGRMQCADGPRWLTQGDNCAEVDAPVATSAICGEVTTLQRDHDLWHLRSVRWQVAGLLIAVATHSPWPRSIRRAILRLLATLQFGPVLSRVEGHVTHD